MGVKFRLIAALALIASLFATTLTASAQDVPPYNPHAYEFATDEFYDVWERTDRPVQEGATERTWLWGPGANTPLIQEPYVEAGDNQLRDVQYTDKSRMEMPWAEDADPESPWFITQGLLAHELMTGQLQIGDAEFFNAFPAEIQVAGDPGSPGPTYLTMGSAMDNDPRSEGNVIVDVITADGFIFQNEALGPAYNVTDEYFTSETGFYVASVFWDFMTSSGPVYDDGILQTGQVFQSPFYAVGFPTTPAYWAWVTVNQVEQNVLVQCFERRCLTYTPNNPSAWQVESGNVGQHYFDWRYNQVGDISEPVPDPDPAEANSFSVSPQNATNALGDTHDITVTVLDQYGEPFAGAGVSASVTATTTAGDAHLGVELTPDDASSGADGIATLSYTGQVEGTDTITVEVEGIEGSQTVTKTWAEYSLNLDPEESTNPLESQHSIEITVVDSDDEQVDIAATGDVTAEITRVFDDAADDDEPVNVGAYEVEVDDGIATLSYDGPNEPAQDTIEITVMVEGVSVTGTATKTWAGPELVLDPEDSEKLVSTEASLTASIQEVDGTQVDFDDDEDGISVSVTRDFDDDSTPDETLSSDDAGDVSVQVDDGVATITYDGADEPATDTIEVSVTIDDVDYSASTTKTWVSAVVSISPDGATNPFFEGASAFSFNLLTAAYEADAISGTFDVDQFFVDLVAFSSLDDALEAQLDSGEVDAVNDAIANAGMNEHTFTVNVATPAVSNVETFDVTVSHDGTTIETWEDQDLTDGSASLEFVYEAEGLGFDDIVVEVGDETFNFEEAKEWIAQPVATDNELDLTPLDPAPNPVGTDHTVTGTLTESDTSTTGIANAVVVFDVDDGPNDGLTGAGFTDSDGAVDFTYTDEAEIADTDTIAATASYFDGDGNLVQVQAAPATKEWYVPAAEIELTVISDQYNHPGNEPWDAYDLQVELKDAGGNTVAHPSGQLDLVFTRDSGGSFLDESGDPQQSVTVTSVDGFAEVTLASSRDPQFNIRPTTVNVTVNADGVDPDSEELVFAGVYLELDLDDIDGAPAGSVDNDITASVTNFDESDGGIDYDAVQFRITISGPVDCTGDDWGEWFNITDVNNSGDPEGINDTFDCVDGSYVGFWGPSTGFPLDAGDQNNTIFEVETDSNAPVGSYTIGGELIDKNDGDAVIVSISDTFEIIDEV